MKKGTVVLTPFPFTDLTTTKRRPAVIVSKVIPQKNDVVVAFISSVIPSRLSETDLLVDQNEPDFRNSGLLKTSVIKVDKLLTIEKHILTGEIGNLPERFIKELDKRLKLTFDLNN